MSERGTNAVRGSDEPRQRGWGTLFAPSDSCDQSWLGGHYEDVAALGFYVFESEDFGYLLGIDAGGFDFYSAFWIPLYELRGLQWHASGD